MGLEIYKHGQGQYTRLWSAVGTAVIVGLGCFRLYEKMGILTNNLWVQTMVPTAVFLVLAALLYWAANKPSVADFMISAEGEVKKVNWSSRAEISVSTFIVVLVVFVLATLLGVTDLMLQLMFNSLLG